MLINLKEGEYYGNNLKSRENTFFKLSMTYNEPNSRTEKHYHDNVYVSIPTKGIYKEKNNTTESLICSGDIVFRPKAYIHENIFDNQGGMCFNIEFKSDWKSQMDINPELPAKFTHYKSGSFPSLYKLLFNFQQDYNEDLAFEFICNWMFQLKNDSHFYKYQPWVNKVQRIIESELETFHSLKELSERVFVHPVYLARAFKEKTGQTIGEYQIKSKLANAIHLLLNTKLNIGEIAFYNGFFDDAHFIRTFKSSYKVSPHQFRLALKK